MGLIRVYKEAFKKKLNHNIVGKIILNRIAFGIYCSKLSAI